MTAEIEKQIELVLSTESSALELSDKLFGTRGLFHSLASTKAERSKLVKSPLFLRAQKRFRELQYREAAEFSKSVSAFRPDLMMKAERA